MSGEAKKLKDEGTRLQIVTAGAFAGLVSRFCIAPLDVIKIRLQLQCHSLSDPLSHANIRGPIYKGTLNTLKQILRTEGLTALWKGNIPAEALYITYGAIQWSAYKACTKTLHQLPDGYKIPDAAVGFASGALAGSVATTATYPLDLLRTRFAAQGPRRVYASIRASLINIRQTEGWRGFYMGLTAGLSQIVPYMGLFFAGYETLKIPLATYSLPLGTGDAAAGVLASVLAKTAVFPLDTTRKRLQVQGPTRARYVHANIPEYKGVAGTIKAILAREGIRGLYRGLMVSLLKAAPTSAITVWAYERAMKLLIGMEKWKEGETEL